jgi:hypothetical protein
MKTAFFKVAAASYITAVYLPLLSKVKGIVNVSLPEIV